MISVKSSALLVMGTLLAALLGGCAGSYQARSVDLKGSDTLLVNPDLLVKGQEGQMLYRYINPAVNFSQYTNVLVDPVVIYKEAKLDKEDQENYQKLATNAYLDLTQQLGQDYQIVSAPQAGTIRVQFAITDAEKSGPVRNIISTVIPQAVALSGIKYLITGKMIGVGEITAEMRFTDAMTGELLAAGYDRRVGGKDLGESFNTWYNAEQALLFWAKQIRYQGCVLRGGSNCVKPVN
jgi:hypothetical protein